MRKRKFILKLFRQSYYGKESNLWSWEMTDDRIYICAYSDDGYTTKANARRAALRCADKFGIGRDEITEAEESE
jgi:hypothetical protein